MKKLKESAKNRLKIMAAVGLIVALGLGGTLAYMTDYEQKNNRFTVGSVDFNLYERNWDGELPDGTYATSADASSSDASSSDASYSNALGIEQAEDMYAGKVIRKDPAIKNNSKNDAYVRMSVKIPVATISTADRYGNLINGGVPTATELFSYDLNADSGMRHCITGQKKKTDIIFMNTFILAEAGMRFLYLPVMIFLRCLIKSPLPMW